MRTWFAAACVLAAAPAFAQMPAVVNGTLESRPLTQTVEREIRKKAVFALSPLPKDEGVPKLIEVAGTHRDAAVRRQAMFWLGQSRDPRALAFFEQVLRD